MNSIEQDRYELIIYDSFSFSPHLHRFLELTYVMEGELTITVNGITEQMAAGDMAFVFPNHPHSYRRNGRNKVAVFIIANDYIPSVSKLISNASASHYVFRPESYITHTLECALIKEKVPDSWEIKAAIYLLMHSFLEQNEILENNQTESDLMQQIVGYVAENYSKDITMMSMASALGYDRQYLSHKFNQMMNINFRTYLNLFRIDHACILLRETDKSITAISLESGFQNIRSFNRTFCNATGSQPTKYRENYKNSQKNHFLSIVRNK